MQNSEELHKVTLSKERLSEIIKRELYSLGYGRLRSEYIDDIDIPVDETMPVHFWIKKDGGEEVFESISKYT